VAAQLAKLAEDRLGWPDATGGQSCSDRWIDLLVLSIKIF